MTTLSASRIHICQGGRIYRFRYLGRTWVIEVHHYFGPMWLKSDLEPRANPQPGPRSLFWKAYEHLQNMEPAKRQRCEI